MKFKMKITIQKECLDNSNYQKVAYFNNGNKYWFALMILNSQFTSNKNAQTYTNALISICNRAS